MKTRVAIIGAGLAGLSAAWHLRRHGVSDDAVTLLDAAARPGGLAVTDRREGFHFDKTGHYLHLRHDHIKSWIGALMGDNLVAHERVSMIYSQGVFTHYPYQANTHGLPNATIAENLQGYFAARDARAGLPADYRPRSFAEWIDLHLGAGFAKNFMTPYNRKLWRVDPSEISAEWCDRFVPAPEPRDVIRGAVGLSAQQLGYNAKFFYPRAGGIGTLAEAIAAQLGGVVRLSETVTKIDLAARKLSTAGGLELEFDLLVNTMPLPKLVETIATAPTAIRDAAKKLRATSVAYCNAAIKRWNAPRCHWFYLPEERFTSYRVGCYTHIDPGFSPPGTWSCYVEQSLAAGDKFDPAAVEQSTLDDLLAIKLIDSPGDVVFLEPRLLPGAYVLYDQNYSASRGAIHAWLDENHARSIGRWGDWNYSSMEDALVNGVDAAAWAAPRLAAP